MIYQYLLHVNFSKFSNFHQFFSIFSLPFFRLVILLDIYRAYKISTFSDARHDQAYFKNCTSFKLDFILNVSTSFVRKKPTYAYANDFHIIFLFYRILEQSLFRDYDVISQNPVENRKNIIQKILCTSFVHIENAILELLHMFYFENIQDFLDSRGANPIIYISFDSKFNLLSIQILIFEVSLLCLRKWSEYVILDFRFQFLNSMSHRISMNIRKSYFRFICVGKAMILQELKSESIAN